MTSLAVPFTFGPDGAVANRAGQATSGCEHGRGGSISRPVDRGVFGLARWGAIGQGVDRGNAERKGA